MKRDKNVCSDGLLFPPYSYFFIPQQNERKPNKLCFEKILYSVELKLVFIFLFTKKWINCDKCDLKTLAQTVFVGPAKSTEEVECANVGTACFSVSFMSCHHLYSDFKG